MRFDSDRLTPPPPPSHLLHPQWDDRTTSSSSSRGDEPDSRNASYRPTHVYSWQITKPPTDFHCSLTEICRGEMRGYRAIKYTLFICCYVLWVASAVLVAVGIYAKIAKEKDVVDTLMLDPALLLIVVGAAMFLITFLGCFGALRNATCLLKTFLGILAGILFLQIAAGVVGYLFTDMPQGATISKLQHEWLAEAYNRKEVMERTESLMMKAIVRYREDQDLENAIDFIQKKFQCCGVERYKDWSNNVYFECLDTNPSLEACGVPFSCCIRPQNQTVLNTMCGYGMQQLEERTAGLNIFTIGCLEKVVWWAKNNLLLVAGLTAGLLLLKVCMICLAAAQISRIKKVQQLKNAPRRRSERQDSYWRPAFDRDPGDE